MWNFLSRKLPLAYNCWHCRMMSLSSLPLLHSTSRGTRWGEIISDTDTVTVCLICMKYRIIILIIIIKRLGEILLSYMANTSHTHALTQCRCIFHHSTSWPVLLVDDVVSRPITPEIHLLSLTIFTQEALATRICMNLSVSYPNWYELKWYACANYLWMKNRICGQRCRRNGSCLHLA